ncbi:VTT domain-containing protein [Streptomyces phaeochromogenes]|uniref:VTT domain-containing protein n=1 Tax=Streptomyces phaeochromogenes TaxID=1923 RepID=A0ABZ1HHD5_STRPH|nr:VTT domain-containing protein [Streptomyces phaeochromogenes]WSD16982.1 VTT domain-containing protein [Streptomyces phaeochromogenes]
MTTTLAIGPSWLDPDYLLDSFGIWGLLLIVFAESGLLIGFFLPGDSLLFTAGLLITSNQLDFPLWAAVVLICIAAIVGDQVGYMFGKKVGPSLFTRPDSRLFKQENVVKAHEFFEKHGPKSLVLARFVPIVRTFTPIIAGVSGMKYRSFLIFNVVGGILWGAGVTLLGSWLGQIDFVKKNIEPILLLIVFISVVPIIIEFMRARGKSKKNPQQQPPAGHMPPAAPAMDDQTTQLRRIPPAHENGQDDYYGNGHNNGQNQQYQQQPYAPDQGYDQNYGGYPQGQDQYAQQYPQGQNQGYPQNQQYPQDPYPQDQNQGQQYPQNQGHPYGPNYPQN